ARAGDPRAGRSGRPRCRESASARAGAGGGSKADTAVRAPGLTRAATYPAAARQPALGSTDCADCAIRSHDIPGIGGTGRTRRTALDERIARATCTARRKRTTGASRAARGTDVTRAGYPAYVGTRLRADDDEHHRLHERHHGATGCRGHLHVAR